jgi:NTE family protein
MNLSASSFEEYRGTDTGFVRGMALRRIADLPSGSFQAVYAFLGYEGGEVWSPESPALLRQDGVAGLLASTPFGVFTFGGAVGDTGRRKVFVSLGKWF